MTDKPCTQTASSYNRGCRCEGCREAIRVRQQSRIAQRKAKRLWVGGRWIAPVALEAHGRPTTYVNHACRCLECTEAWRLYFRGYAADRNERGAS